MSLPTRVTIVSVDRSTIDALTDVFFSAGVVVCASASSVAAVLRLGDLSGVVVVVDDPLEGLGVARARVRDLVEANIRLVLVVDRDDLAAAARTLGVVVVSRRADRAQLLAAVSQPSVVTDVSDVELPFTD